MRQTKTVTTSSGHTADVYEYITARERLEVAKKLGSSNAEGVSMEGAEAGQSALVSAMVVALNGSRDDVLNRCLDLPAADFDEVIAAINESFSPQKKTS